MMRSKIPMLVLSGAVVASVGDRAEAVEGGFATYLLGTRDLVMGVVPGPSVYLSHDVVYYRGDLSAATNLAGVLAEDADLKLLLNKTVLTAVAPGQLLGAASV